MIRQSSFWAIAALAVLLACTVSAKKGTNPGEIAVPVPGSSSLTDVQIVYPTFGIKVSGAIRVTNNLANDPGIVNVELYVDGRLYGSSATSPFTVTWNAGSESKGFHRLQLRAYDSVGNFILSQEIVVSR